MLEVKPSHSRGAGVLRLIGDLTIYSVGDARKDLEAQLHQQPTLTLDLSEVEEVDTAGVQLLHWLKQEAEALGGNLALQHHSPAVVEVFELLGVIAHFGDPIIVEN
nr:STAS domain-containing protein [uncultured Holophaga sp.]